MSLRNPIQPMVMVDGILRFKKNVIVDALLEHGKRVGIDLNRLHVMFPKDEHTDDWRQFAQLIGYSLSGFGDLSYVDNETFYAAQAMEHTTEEQARIETMANALEEIRESLLEPIAKLYGIDPDDLKS